MKNATLDARGTVEMKLSPGRRVMVRYVDRAWYPAMIVKVNDDGSVTVKWDPPDPKIPPTWIVHDGDDIR